MTQARKETAFVRAECFFSSFELRDSDFRTRATKAPGLDRGILRCRLEMFGWAGLDAWRHSQQSGAAFGPAACAATLVARLLVILATAHLFFDARVFNQFSKSLDGVGNRFVLAQTQFDHKTLLVTLNCR
jgi:hypothetical protein